MQSYTGLSGRAGLPCLQQSTHSLDAMQTGNSVCKEVSTCTFASSVDMAGVTSTLGRTFSRPASVKRSGSKRNLWEGGGLVFCVVVVRYETKPCILGRCSCCIHMAGPPI